MTSREYQYGNVTIVIHRPELSDKELRKQEETLLIALQQFGKAMKEKNKHGNIN